MTLIDTGDDAGERWSSRSPLLYRNIQITDVPHTAATYTLKADGQTRRLTELVPKFQWLSVRRRKVLSTS